MPEIVCLAITGLSSVIALVLMLYAIMESATVIPVLILFIAIPVGGGWWMYRANNTPRPIVSEQIFTVSNVKNENGTYVQAIQIDPLTKKNITNVFGAVLPEGSQVKRTIRSGWSCGMYLIEGEETYYSYVGVEK
jgi:hypothetical protein